MGSFFVAAERLCRIVGWCVVQQPLEAYLLQGIGAVGCSMVRLACLPFMEEVICAPSALSSSRSTRNSKCQFRRYFLALAWIATTPCFQHSLRGRPVALDVTVISTLQQSTVQGAATVQGHALLVGEERKFAAHAEACHSGGGVSRRLGDETASTIAAIGRLMGQRLGISPTECTRHLFQRCAISLWRGNAALWIRRCPTRAPSVDGLL